MGIKMMKKTSDRHQIYKLTDWVWFDFFFKLYAFILLTSTLIIVRDLNEL